MGSAPAAGMPPMPAVGIIIICCTSSACCAGVVACCIAAASAAGSMGIAGIDAVMFIGSGGGGSDGSGGGLLFGADRVWIALASTERYLGVPTASAVAQRRRDGAPPALTCCVSGSPCCRYPLSYFWGLNMRNLTALEEQAVLLSCGSSA